MSDDEYKQIILSVSFFVDNVLSDMSKISRSTTKSAMISHVEYWKNELLTIKNFTNLDGFKR
jgi:hypothetical protein